MLNFQKTIQMLTRNLGLLIMIMLLLVQCSEKPTQEQTSPAEPTEISLTKNQISQTGIEIGKAEKKMMSEQIIANGTVDVPPQFRASISLAVGGFVKSTEVLEGDHVHKGEVLAAVSHPDYIQIQQQYLETLSKETMLRKEMDRQELLRQENVNSKKDYERIQAELQINIAQSKALAARLEILGISPQKVSEGVITSEVYVRSPINGDVTLVNTTLGKYVKAEETIFEVIGKDHIHLDLQVYEQDVLKIKEGQKVLYSVSNDKVQRNAKVILVGKKLNEESRTVSIHAHPIDMKEGILPGMYVKGRILSNEAETTVLPEDAIVREGDRSVIFVVKVINQESIVFEKVQVEVGTAAEGMVPVVIPENYLGKDIVKKGAYFIGAQLKKSSAAEE